MQIPGRTCDICQAKLVYALDGTWCAECGCVFHSACLTEADLVCPGCQRAYTPPDQEELLTAQGRLPHSRPPSRRSLGIGAWIEITIGALFLFFPLGLFFYLASRPPPVPDISSPESIVLWPLRLGSHLYAPFLCSGFAAIVTIPLGIALVVAGERDWRRRR